jgi:hypothetical protein
MKHNIDTFLEELYEKVELFRTEYPLPIMAFTAYVTGEIALLTNVNKHSVVHCIKKDKEGKPQGEIHGYGINENEEILTLYYSIYSDTPKKNIVLLRSDFDKAINRLQGFYNYAIRGAHMDIEEGSNEYETFKFIYDHQVGIKTVRLCVLSNCYIRDYEVRDIRIDGKNVEHDIWDINKIYANLHSGSNRVAIDLDFEEEFNDFKLPYIEVCPDNCDYKYVSTVFPAKLLYRLYEKYDSDLLYGNLRLFLKFRGRKNVNANINIRQTIKEENENMLAYNNGIVAIAESFEGRSVSDYISMDKGNEAIIDDIARTGIISHLFDFRIINGGQTTTCIFDIKRNNKSVNLSGVYVPVKIIIPQQIDSNLVYNVIKNTHIQSRLSPKDYDKGSLFDIKFEELSRSTMVPNKTNKPQYWFFERIRRQYDSKKCKTRLERESFLKTYPTNKRFKKEDLAKVWVCWNQSPNEAVKGSFTMTSYYMDSIVNSELVPDVLYYKKSIALLVIYKYLLSRQKNADYGNGKSPVIAYSMAYLSMFTNGNLNYDKIWKEQDLSAEMKAFLDSLCDSVWEKLQADADANDKTVWSYSKRSDVYDTIKMTDFGLSIESIRDDLIERGW